MGICNSCGRNDEEPLGHCPKCSIGEQADGEGLELAHLRAQLARIVTVAEAAGWNGVTNSKILAVWLEQRLAKTSQELEIDRLRAEISAAFTRVDLALSERDTFSAKLKEAIEAAGAMEIQLDLLRVELGVAQKFVQSKNAEIERLEANLFAAEKVRDGAIAEAAAARRERDALRLQISGLQVAR